MYPVGPGREQLNQIQISTLRMMESLHCVQKSQEFIDYLLTFSPVFNSRLRPFTFERPYRSIRIR